MPLSFPHFRIFAHIRSSTALASAFRRPRPLASAADVRFHSSQQHDILLFGGVGVCGVDDGRRSHLPLRADSRPRFYSSSSVIRRGYSRLHVGFASLPDAPPLSSSSDESTTSGESSDDIESDPQAAVVLASLRGGAKSFDCPAPPSIVEGDTRHPSGAKGDATCWDASRDGETRLANSLDRAREALKEDGEEGDGRGDGPSP